MKKLKFYLIILLITSLAFNQDQSLDKSIKEINLNQLLEEYPKMLEGKTSGRYIINLNK